MRKTVIHLGVVMTAVASYGCGPMSNAEIAARVIQGSIIAAQGFFISEADEIKIGQETKSQVFAEMPAHPNPIMRDYVTEIGNKMVAQSARKNLRYEFYALESPEVNAFAAPGGFIFVTTGALRLMTNEAQLAGVIGHEVGHVVKRHSIEGIKKAMIAQGVASATLGNDSSKLTQLGANIAANLILKGFDRDQELEADTLGAQYAYTAGYDPRELGAFLDALRKTSEEQPAWLTAVSDHPRTDDRLSLLKKYIIDQKMDLGKLTTGGDAFKTKVTDVVGSALPSPSPSPLSSPSPAPAASPTELASPEPSPAP